MGRYTGPKAKLCRREGTNLFGSAKYTKILTKRNFAPGSQAGARTGKPSEFANQLREKQKLARMFGISAKQLETYFKKASRMPGVTSNHLLALIESRLDNVLYRAGFALTRMQARQSASHGHVMLNGKRVTIPSINIRPGDKIEIREKLKQSKLFEDVLKENAKYKAPSWLQADQKKLSIEILDLPGVDHFEQTLDTQKIVEFYSK